VPADLLGVPLVHAVGGDLTAQVEDHPNPSYVDHVWITMSVGGPERLLVSINTLSKRNREAGFDPRIRLGLVRGEWTTLPPRGLAACPRLDYADIEKAHTVFFEHTLRQDLEDLLVESAHRAVLLEAWGAPYRNKRRLGLHQIHSRRGSCAVPSDIQGLDGALKFYFPRNRETMLLLFKFCGQP
jgi:hypothetical protein